jgi:hypothetical protein
VYQPWLPALCPVTAMGALNAIIGVLLGSTFGRHADRRTAARKMADGGAGALVDHGREVRATPLGLAVTPRAVGNGV